MSYSKGYKNIEIDLLVTNDSHIFGAHDIKLFKRLTNYHKGDIINYDYIRYKKIINKYHIIYDSKLLDLLNLYKDVNIFTDKICNYHLLKKYATITDRVYVEVFNYEQFFYSKNNGFKNVMLNVQTEKELSFLLYNNCYSVKAITVGPHIFYTYSNILKLLFKRNIKIFVFLVKNKKDIKHSLCKYVNGFYLD